MTEGDTYSTLENFTVITQMSALTEWESVSNLRGLCKLDTEITDLTELIRKDAINWVCFSCKLLLSIYHDYAPLHYYNVNLFKRKYNNASNQFYGKLKKNHTNTYSLRRKIEIWLQRAQFLSWIIWMPRITKNSILVTCGMIILLLKSITIQEEHQCVGYK